MSLEFAISNDVCVESVESFLSAEAIKDSLEYAIGDCRPLKISKIVVSAGSAPGDNYLGVIYRAKVTYLRIDIPDAKDEIKSLIIKSIPISKQNEFLRDMNAFLREKFFYREVLTRLEFLNDSTAEKFGAKLYDTIGTPIKCLILEDLLPQHRLVSRELGLDFQHAQIVMQKLGKFHALSMVLEGQDTGLMKCFHTALTSPMMLEEDGIPLKLYSNGIAALQNVISNWKGFEKISEKFTKFRAHFRENLLSFVASQPDDIKVLNHGDLWVNNVLFKYKGSNPEDCAFIDFQMSLWGSPGFDLNYFFNSSLRLDVLQTRRLELLKSYYDSFSRTLNKHAALNGHGLRNPIPTFKSILHEVEKRECWGFFACFTIFPIAALDKDQSQHSSVETMADDEFTRRKLEVTFSSPRCQGMLKYSLKRFDDLGIFD